MFLAEVAVKGKPEFYLLRPRADYLPRIVIAGAGTAWAASVRLAWSTMPCRATEARFVILVGWYWIRFTRQLLRTCVGMRGAFHSVGANAFAISSEHAIMPLGAT